MRLTLRTLLAWMDGMLAADAAGQLAEKVSGSAIAQTLANRIRDVVSRPTIAAVPAEGRGLAADPNTAAEFLDNVLPAERLAEFERVCIESDMQLAEVADCHRLLADLTAGRSAVDGMDPMLAERLVTLVASERSAGRGPGGDRGAIEAAAALGDDWLPQVVRVNPTPTVPAEGALVSPTARAPVRAWMLAGSALLALVGLLGVLAWSLSAGGRGDVAARLPAAAPEAVTPPRDAPPTPDSPATPAVAPVAPPAAPSLETAQEPPVAPGDPAESASSPVAPPPVATPAAVPPPAPPAEPAVVAADPTPAAGAVRVPQGEALAIAAAGPVPPSSEPAGRAAPPASPVAVEPPVATVAGPFVLLAAVSDAPQRPLVWQPRPAGASIRLPADLVSPPFSQPELVFGRLRIRLLPSTRAAVLSDADGAIRLEVLFGRAVVLTDDPSVRLGVTAGGLVGRVRTGLGPPLGVEVSLDRPPGSDPAAGSATRRARIVSAGGIAWEQTAEDGGPATGGLRGLEPDGRVPPGAAIEWSSTTADEVAIGRGAATPDWLAGGIDVDAADRQAAIALEGCLPADGPVQPALRQLADDPRGERRVLAAATLALLGDYDEAVRQLAAEDRGRELYAGQWAKLEGLVVPLALARGANAAARLAAAFAAQAPAGTGESLARLARGLTPAELAAGGDAWLVAALDDPHLVVRRYAFQRLTELVHPSAVDRLRYRPDGRPEQRRDGIEWWQRLQQEGRLRGAATAPP